MASASTCSSSCGSSASQPPDISRQRRGSRRSSCAPRPRKSASSGQAELRQARALRGECRFQLRPCRLLREVRAGGGLYQRAADGERKAQSAQFIAFPEGLDIAGAGDEADLRAGDVQLRAAGAREQQSGAQRRAGVQISNQGAAAEHGEARGDGGVVVPGGGALRAHGQGQGRTAALKGGGYLRAAGHEARARAQNAVFQRAEDGGRVALRAAGGEHQRACRATARHQQRRVQPQFDGALDIAEEAPGVLRRGLAQQDVARAVEKEVAAAGARAHLAQGGRHVHALAARAQGLAPGGVPPRGGGGQHAAVIDIEAQRLDDLQLLDIAVGPADAARAAAAGEQRAGEQERRGAPHFPPSPRRRRSSPAMTPLRRRFARTGRLSRARSAPRPSASVSGVR